MEYLGVFIFVALLEILSAILIFYFKDILHSIIAFSLVFVFNSFLFFMLENPLLGLIQLFIMVGGVSTYIFVGASYASYSKFKYTNYLFMGISAIAIFAITASKIFQSSPISVEQNVVNSTVIAQSIPSNLGIFYMIAIMLFGVGFGSIILMRKLGRK